MSWFYKNKIVEEIPEDCIGFVYCIHNELTGKKYIGKKLFYFSKATYKTIKLKNGTKRKKRIKGQRVSDWQDYWGSNEELKHDVLYNGIKHFTREILHFCKTKSECSYMELKEQVIREALISDMYYNGIIQVKIHRNHLKKK